MGYQVWVYEWPENQECLRCKHNNSILTSEDWVDGSEGGAMSVCTLNHDKMCDRDKDGKWKCLLFKEVTEGANNSNNTTERNG